MQKLTAMVNTLVGIFQRGDCTIRKAETHTKRRSATTSYKPRRSMCARVKRQLLSKWPRGLPHLREFMLSCACVRAVANLRPKATVYDTPMEAIDLDLYKIRLQ